jgi:hypothetical protein
MTSFRSINKVIKEGANAPFFEALTNNYALISYTACIFLFVLYFVIYTEDIVDIYETLIDNIQYSYRLMKQSIILIVREVRAKLWVKMIEMDVVDKTNKLKMSPNLEPQSYYPPYVKEFSLNTDRFKHRKVSDTEKKIEFQSININDAYSIKMFAIVEEK